MQTEIEKRTNIARTAIKSDLNKSGEETATQLFVAHHLEEVDASYWQAQLGTAQPTSQSILDLLVLRSHWAVKNDEIDETGADVFDFTLPGETTQYVLCVRFDEKCEIASIEMES